MFLVLVLGSGGPGGRCGLLWRQRRTQADHPGHNGPRVEAQLLVDPREGAADEPEQHPVGGAGGGAKHKRHGDVLVEHDGELGQQLRPQTESHEGEGCPQRPQRQRAQGKEVDLRHEPEGRHQDAGGRDKHVEESHGSNGGGVLCCAVLCCFLSPTLLPVSFSSSSSPWHPAETLAGQPADRGDGKKYKRQRFPHSLARTSGPDGATQRTQKAAWRAPRDRETAAFSRTTPFLCPLLFLPRVLRTR